MIDLGITRRVAAVFLAGMASLLMASGARATYSIVGCDVKTRECGVAVETNNLAVGASVPYARAGVGAVASQFETNPNYGVRGLALLAAGESPAEALEQLLSEDGNFEGAGTESRLVAIVSMVAVHSGAEVLHAVWAGERHGPGYSIEGNGLVGAEVLEVMERAYLKTTGSFAERLMAALVAGDRAGGQKTGRESAALLVKTMDGWPVDVDLRVDHSADPVGDLRTLFDMQEARVEMGQARRAANGGDFKEARRLTAAAVTRASGWSRIWLQAAQLAVRIEDRDLALRYLQVAFTQNPKWVESEIGDGEYAALGRFRSFHQWVTPGKRKDALEAYEKLQAAAKASVAERMEVGRKLMEVGCLVEARKVVEGVVKGDSDNVEAQKLLAEMDGPAK